MWWELLLVLWFALQSSFEDHVTFTGHTYTLSHVQATDLRGSKKLGKDKLSAFLEITVQTSVVRIPCTVFSKLKIKQNKGFLLIFCSMILNPLSPNVTPLTFQPNTTLPPPVHCSGDTGYFLPSAYRSLFQLAYFSIRSSTGWNPRHANHMQWRQVKSFCFLFQDTGLMALAWSDVHQEILHTCLFDTSKHFITARDPSQQARCYRTLFFKASTFLWQLESQ